MHFLMVQEFFLNLNSSYFLSLQYLLPNILNRNENNIYQIEDDTNKTLFALFAGYADVYALPYVTVSVEVTGANTFTRLPSSFDIIMLSPFAGIRRVKKEALELKKSIDDWIKKHPNK